MNPTPRKPPTLPHPALNRTTALLFKPKAGTDVALSGFFALLAGFVSESLPVRQLVLRRRSAPIILVVKVIIGGPKRVIIQIVILRRSCVRRHQQQTCN